METRQVSSFTIGVQQDDSSPTLFSPCPLLVQFTAPNGTFTLVITSITTLAGYAKCVDRHFSSKGRQKYNGSERQKPTPEASIKPNDSITVSRTQANGNVCCDKHWDNVFVVPDTLFLLQGTKKEYRQGAGAATSLSFSFFLLLVFFLLCHYQSHSLPCSLYSFSSLSI